MDDLRLTVVSDATQEFPHNQNNRFKARLPRPLTLPEGPWAMSLWSLSVPDEAVEQALGQGSDYVCRFSDVIPRLSMVQGGKYTKITNEDDHWVSMFITLTDAFTTRPKTGVEFWTRVHQRIDEIRTRKLQTEFEKNTAVRLQQPLAWTPTFRWEGDDWILQANKIVPHDNNTHGHPFALSLKIAHAFGFVKQDPKTKKWLLGPNLVPSYPVYDRPPLAMADFTAYSPQGPTVYLARKWDTRFLPLEWQWFRLQNQGVYFKFDQIELTNAMEWRFIHLNRSYARLTN